MQMQAPESPPMPGEMSAQIETKAEEVTLALLNACKVMADNCAGSQDMREAQESAKAALNLAQAIVVLDPELDGQGTPLAQQLMVEQERAAGAIALERTRGENALAQAREAARAPTPQRSVQVKRDSNGRAASYDVTGG